MEKSNTMLLTVIAIATLLVAVIGATFAYFAATSTIDASIPVNVNTAANTASFTATPNKDININVDANEMQQADASATAQSNVTEIIGGLTDSATLNIILKAAEDNQISKCTYDIIWTWTSEKYALEGGTDTKHYWPTTGVNKEFTIQGSATTTNTQTVTTTPALEETNFSNFPADKVKTKTDGKDYIVLVDDAAIAVSDTNGGNALWTFTVRFYNSLEPQNALMGKKLSGTISVDPDSVKC